MDNVIITKVAQSVQRLHPHMREDVHTSHHSSIALLMTIMYTAAAKHAVVNAAITFLCF